jgi:hypothetical protein
VNITYLKWFYGNYNRKDVCIAQCSFWFFINPTQINVTYHMGLFKFRFLQLKYKENYEKKDIYN